MARIFELGGLSNPHPIGNQIKIVTNIQHEENINEEKRKIKLPKPEFVEEIAGQFRSLIRGR